jgi:hypothetical protein
MGLDSSDLAHFAWSWRLTGTEQIIWVQKCGIDSFFGINIANSDFSLKLDIG